VRPIYRTGTPLRSKYPILYIFSTNIRTEFFKHSAHSPFFSLQNAVYFIMLPFGSCIIRILHTECAKIWMPNSGAKRLNFSCHLVTLNGWATIVIVGRLRVKCVLSLHHFNMTICMWLQYILKQVACDVIIIFISFPFIIYRCSTIDLEVVIKYCTILLLLPY
jgi:hypothetical protein